MNQSSVQRLGEALSKSRERDTLLLEVLSVLARLDEIDQTEGDATEAVREALKATALALGCENSSIMLCDRAQGVVALHAGYGTVLETGQRPSLETWHGNGFALGEGIAGRVADSGAARLVPDTSAEADFVCLEEHRVEAGSLLCTPLGNSGTVIGVLNASHRHKSFFPPESVPIAELIAARLANMSAIRSLAAGQRHAPEHLELAASATGIEQDTEEQPSALGRQGLDERGCPPMLEETGMGYHLMDEEGRILEANGHYARLTGHRRVDEIIGRKVSEWTSEERIEAKRLALADCVERGVLEDFETTCVHPDGTRVHLLVNGVAHRTTEGVRISAYCWDITEKTKAEEVVRRSEENYRTIFNAVNDGIIVHDVESGAVRDINRRVVELFGCSEEEARASNIGDLSAGVLPYTQAQAMAHMRKAADGEPQHFEWLSKDIKGRLFWVEVGLKRVAIGGRDCILAVIRDIDERKQIEEALEKERQNLEEMVEARTRELRQSLEELEEANRQKSRFLSTISHELRTPLNGVLGFVQLLQQNSAGTLTGKQRRYVELIETSGSHLLALINDLLDVAKIDVGRMELNLRHFRLGMQVASVCEDLEKQCAEKGIRLTRQVEKDMAVHGDERRCRQILMNLLTNAIKFTPPGGCIEVRAAKHEDDFALVLVEDTGIGIEPRHQPHVFSEFFQVKEVYDAQLGGTGIGLALTRRLVEMHGGQIGVESVRGEGSTFWFTLPLVTGQEPGTAEEEPPVEDHTQRAAVRAKAGPRILVAEDDAVNTVLISDILESGDYEVILARNGAEALQLARERKPDLILMDIRMPVMDGLEATRRLRQTDGFADTPIIALSASADAEAVERCMEAGCTAHLPKPIDMARLRETLSCYVGAGNGQSSQGREGGA